MSLPGATRAAFALLLSGDPALWGHCAAAFRPNGQQLFFPSAQT
ncbi:MAG TPA: hypothetical protein VF800_27685 [Telluria sp.]|jgi:hypothetical protein